MLSQRETVHDLRLRGSIGVPHQIDAVVGDEHTRVLIEAKDYERTVDLPVVRNFWAVVEDVQPTEAFIVTTKGFSDNAATYARAKGIKLAMLRPPQEEDWQGLVRRVNIKLVATGHGVPKIEWEIHSDDHHKVQGEREQLGLAETDSMQLADAEGNLTPFVALLDEQLKAEYGAVPPGGEATIGRLNPLSEPTWLHAPDMEPLRVTAWKWSAQVSSSETEMAVGEGLGGLAAELVLRTVDGTVRQMFSNRQISSWSFDGKSVVPRDPASGALT
jgi:hypothetical protein